MINSVHVTTDKDTKANAEKLAINDPMGAAMNSQSYEFFAEDHPGRPPACACAVGGDGRTPPTWLALCGVIVMLVRRNLRKATCVIALVTWTGCAGRLHSIASLPLEEDPRLACEMAIVEPVTTDNVQLDFRLRNVSHEGLRVLRLFTPLRRLHDDLLDVVCDGNRIPYLFIMLSVRPVQPAENYVTIPAHEAAIYRLNVSDGYHHLPVNSACTIRLGRPEIGDVTTDLREIPHHQSTWKPSLIHCNTVEFHVQ